MLETLDATVMVVFSPIRLLDRHWRNVRFNFQNLVAFLVSYTQCHTINLVCYYFTFAGDEDRVLPFAIVGDEAFPLRENMLRPYQISPVCKLTIHACTCTVHDVLL